MKSNALLIVLVASIIFGCMDNDIEGLKKTGNETLKATKVTSSYDEFDVNQCTWYDDNYKLWSGTKFDFQIDYSGSAKITKVEFTYKFSSETTTYGPMQASFYDYHFDEEATSFRGESEDGSSSYADVEGLCWVFGTNASIVFNFTITDQNNKKTSISYTLKKPAGAN